ncbi:hypothetical protein WJX72_009036 [[Myrmecia] bisecta]|uniref:Uncharacterized protein n=1 Tax=[Myrmecia] bisecta TaxID=41462 RepID=A0AAW1QAX3_9CHLO
MSADLSNTEDGYVTADDDPAGAVTSAAPPEVPSADSSPCAELFQDAQPGRADSQPSAQPTSPPQPQAHQAEQSGCLAGEARHDGFVAGGKAAETNPDAAAAFGQPHAAKLFLAAPARRGRLLLPGPASAAMHSPDRYHSSKAVSEVCSLLTPWRSSQCRARSPGGRSQAFELSASLLASRQPPMRQADSGGGQIC